MGELIAFPAPNGLKKGMPPHRRGADLSSAVASILFFTGVRYERQHDGENRANSQGKGRGKSGGNKGRPRRKRA